MSANIVKPAFNAKRRIQLLFGLVIFLIFGCTAGWYFVSNKIDEIAGNIIEQQASLGNNISCDGREVRGYPFRFGLFCNSVAFESVDQAISFDAGALRSAAQFYAPRDLIIELDSPAKLEQVEIGSWLVNWAQMRARFLATEPLPENISISGQNVVLARVNSKPLAKADALDLFFRVVDRDVDFAGRTTAFEIENLTTQLNELPPLGGDFDIRISDGADLLLSGQQTVRGIEAMLKRVALLLSDDQGIIVSGPLSIADNGLLNAELRIRVVDVNAVLGVLANAMPDAWSLMSAFANGLPRKGEKGDEIELDITIKNGQARLGLIPLGTIGPL